MFRETTVSKGAIVPKGIRTLLVFVLYYFACSMTLNTFMLKWGFNEITARDNVLPGSVTERASFEKMLNGTAHRPFAFRVLTPLVGKVVAELVPNGIQSKLLANENFQKALAKFKKNYRLHDGYEFERLAVYCFMLFSLVATLGALRKYLLVDGSYSQAFADFAPVAFAIVLPMSFLNGGYMYDFPELMFVSLLLLALKMRLMLLYYVLYSLALVNKETTIIMTAAYVGYSYGRDHWKTIAVNVGSHLLVGLVVVAATRYYFRMNPGGGTEWNFWGNLQFMTSLSTYTNIVDVYCPVIPIPRGYNAFNIGVVLFVVLYQWRQKDKLLMQQFLLLLLCHIPIVLLFGFKDEIRNLGMVFPTLFFLACDTFRRLYERCES